MTNKKLINMVMKLKRDVKHLRRLTMSQIPKDTQSKYNKDNKFAWVDSQLEKFMTKQKELEAEIVNLTGKIKNDMDYIRVLEDSVSELKDRLRELGNE